MSSKNAEIRQDLIENGVEHELVPVQENTRNAQELCSSVESELEHDLLVWPREYLEPYLDSDRSGTVPLNEVQLQDLLEAAFERDAELARNALNDRTRTAKLNRSPALATDSQEEPTVAQEEAKALHSNERDANRATGKDLEQSTGESQSSLETAISQLSGSIRLAAGTQIASIRRQLALTDSGVYTGRIVADMPELVIQRISSATEVAHLKDSFTEIPQVGQLLRIAYRDNVATVREIHEHKIEKGLSR